MATNPYVNKVVKSDGTTIMDISDSTVTEEMLPQNIIAYDASGKRLVGPEPPTTWQILQRKVRNNDMSDIIIGDQYTCSYGSSNLTWDVTDKNVDEPVNPNLSHTLTMKTHFQMPDTMQFSGEQAFYACISSALDAGVYYIYDSGNQYYYGFTLYNPVPVGGQLIFVPEGNKDRKYVESYASPTSTTYIDRVSVTASQSWSYGTYLGVYSRSQINGNLNIQSRELGSNNYAESAIRQWLNSDKPASQWWTPQTVWDRPPNSDNTMNGFLCDLDPDFLEVIGKTKVITAEGYLQGEDDTYTTEDYFFLLSFTQVGSSFDVISGKPEGVKYSPYSDDASRITYRNDAASSYMLRSPIKGANNCGAIRFVQSSGMINAVGYAERLNGVIIVCNII